MKKNGLKPMLSLLQPVHLQNGWAWKVNKD